MSRQPDQRLYDGYYYQNSGSGGANQGHHQYGAQQNQYQQYQQYQQQQQQPQGYNPQPAAQNTQPAAQGYGYGYNQQQSGYQQQQTNQYSMPPLPPVLQQEERIVAALQGMFPDVQVNTLRAAARVHRTFDQAAEWLNSMKRQGMFQPGANNAALKQPQVRATMSIRDKFRQGQQQPYAGSTGVYSQPQYSTPQYGGPQYLSMPQYQQQYQQQHYVAQHTTAPKKKLQRKYDEDDFSASDDSESEVEFDAAGQRQFEERVLYFLNTAPRDSIVDVAGCTDEMVDVFLKKRPYATLAQASKVDLPSNIQQTGVRRRGALKKSAGSKIVDASLSTLRGYEAVDSLIQECAELGKNVKEGIRKWGIDLANNHELDFTEIDANPNSNFMTEKPSLLAPDLELKNYQQVGLNWLNLLYSKRLSCILADEMGLGKTCQVISFLALLKERGERGPHLVICPSSTLENWLRELNRFCPALVIEPYYGNQQERAEMRDAIIESGAHFDVMVTTYNLATGGKQDLGFLKSLKFNVCIYDEGHLLKNSQSERYNKLMKLKANFRVLLTGTPLQNNLRELVSLLSFILPNLFEQNKDDLLEVFKFKAKTQNQEANERSQLLSEQRIVKAKTMMAPFVLRRRKAQVLQHLPPKSHEVVFCDMLPHQRELYQVEFNRQRSHIRTANNEVKADSVAGKSKTRKGRQATMALDNVLMKLRQMALHPLLFRNIYDDNKLQKMATDIMQEEKYKEANREYILEDMQAMNDYELNRLCHMFPGSIGHYSFNDEEYVKSGKVKKLCELMIPMKAEGDRILVFSQFTKVLDILEKVLDKINFKYLRLDGQTPVEVRQEMIDKFYEDDSITVFLLSTKAGGFGINLACANVVIIFDLSFNPHDDKQAEDRAHRVGQTRAVKVIRMITRDSIEENIMELANTKLALDRHVSEENENDYDPETEAYVADLVLKDAPGTNSATPAATTSPGTPGGSVLSTPQATPGIETPAPYSNGSSVAGSYTGLPNLAGPAHSVPMSLMAPHMPPRGTPPPPPVRKVGRPPTRRRRSAFDSDLSDDDNDGSDGFSDLDDEPIQVRRRSSRRAAAAAKAKVKEESDDFLEEEESESEEESNPESFVVTLKYKSSASQVDGKQQDGSVEPSEAPKSEPQEPSQDEKPAQIFDAQPEVGNGIHAEPEHASYEQHLPQEEGPSLGGDTTAEPAVAAASEQPLQQPDFEFQAQYEPEYNGMQNFEGQDHLEKPEFSEPIAAPAFEQPESFGADHDQPDFSGPQFGS